MITSFVFDDVEAAYYIGGCSRAVARRVPKRGHVECNVKPCRKDGHIMKRRCDCTIRIYAGIDGKPPYAVLFDGTATARDLYRALRNDGFACDLL